MTNRLIVHYLGWIALLSIGGWVVLTALGKSVSDSLLAVGAASAIGGLCAAFLPGASSRNAKSPASSRDEFPAEEKP